LNQGAAVVAYVVVARAQGVGVRLAVGVSYVEFATRVVEVVVVSKDDPTVYL
jgi:hypothetical protein